MYYDDYVNDEDDDENVCDDDEKDKDDSVVVDFDKGFVGLILSPYRPLLCHPYHIF